MNLTLHFEKAEGTHSDYFGFSGLSHGVYRDTELNKLFDFQLQSNGSDTYSANNIPVQTDLDDVITYMFESGNYWSLDNRDAIVISSPDSTLVGKLYYDESSANFSQVISGSNPTEYTQDSLGIVAHEGNANIYIRVVPKSSLQSINPVMSLMSRKGLSLSRSVLPSLNEVLTEEVNDPKTDNERLGYDKTVYERLDKLYPDKCRRHSRCSSYDYLHCSVFYLLDMLQTNSHDQTDYYVSDRPSRHSVKPEPSDNTV